MSHIYLLFDSLLEPCFVLSKNSQVVYCNESAALALGKTVRKIQKKKFLELFDLSERLEWAENLESIRDPVPYKEVRFSTADGLEGKVQITCQPLPTPFLVDAEPRWIVFVRDVTLEERLQNKYRGELEQKEGYIHQLQQAQAELEKYSKNLEQMVADRTAQIQHLNLLMQTLFDSLAQGFFIFDRNGKCLDFSSKACETILETRPNNKMVWDVLSLPQNKVDGFKKWLTTLFAEMLPFADLAPLGPPLYEHSDGKTIQLEYFPLLDQGTIAGVVVVASDITSLIEARQEAQIEKENAKMILNLVQKKTQVLRFISESQDQLAQISTELRHPPLLWDLELLFRMFHTLKGGAASFHIPACGETAHHAESILAERQKILSNSEIELRRNSTELIACVEKFNREFDQYLNQCQDVLGKSILQGQQTVDVLRDDLNSWCRRISFWTKGSLLAEEIQNKYLLESAEGILLSYQEMALHTASTLGKQIHPLQVLGGSLRLDAKVYGPLFSSLVHAIRNSLDHGIEAPDQREVLGKDPLGLIKIQIDRTQTNLLITFSDDGAGVNPEKIREKMHRLGFDTSGESDQEVIQHIFDANFSTRSQVTDISGRGVGMDAIHSEAKKLGGQCFVTSKINQGMSFVISVPWHIQKEAA